jgi:hypothetical protein
MARRYIKMSYREVVMTIGIIILQYVHILFAATLLGSALFMNIVLWPSLLRRPAAEAKGFFETSLKTTSILMGVSGGITFLSGILRGTVFGSIHSWNDLLAPYGITFSVALLSTLAMMIHGPQIGPRLLKEVWKGREFSPNAKTSVQSAMRISWISVLIILGCMVLMHFGL